jgi:hypothetical protein
MAVEVTLKLPEALVRDAQDLGLLDDEVITRVLQQAVDQRVNEIVNTEIHAYREEKRAKQSGKT